VRLTLLMVERKWAKPSGLWSSLGQPCCDYGTGEAENRMVTLSLGIMTQQQGLDWPSSCPEPKFGSTRKAEEERISDGR
jgi:hypothetical protein